MSEAVGADPAIEELVRILERTPATLRAILEELPEGLIHADEGEGTFSPFSVLGHLVHGEREDWIPRARIIIERGEERPFDPFDRFGHVEATRGRSVEELLQEFARLRRESLESLHELLARGADLTARGTHPELGSVTLSQLLATWVVHDLNHLAQIARVVAHQFEDEVGPWREYLPILDYKRPRDA